MARGQGCGCGCGAGSTRTGMCKDARPTQRAGLVLVDRNVPTLGIVPQPSPPGDARAGAKANQLRQRVAIANSVRRHLPAAVSDVRPVLERHVRSRLGNACRPALLRELLTKYPRPTGPTKAKATLLPEFRRPSDLSRHTGTRAARSGEVIEEYGDDCDDWWSVYRSGAIEFELPTLFPTGDPDFVARDFMLYPFTSDDEREGWLSDETIRSRIRWPLWDLPGLRGSYPGWNTSRGFVTEFAFLAIQLPYSTRRFIPTSWPNPESSWWGVVPQSECANAGRRIHALLKGDYLENHYGVTRLFTARSGDSNGRCPKLGGYQLTVTTDASLDRSRGLPHRPFASTVECQRRYRFTIDTDSGRPSILGFAGFESAETPFLLICASTWQGYAEVADQFLYWGNIAYAAAARGWATDLWSALEYLSMATKCGRIASGALMVPARTVVHELLHTFPAHCETSCCQAGLAGWWWASCRSWLAAAEVQAIRPGVRPFLPYHIPATQESVVDTHFVYPWGAYASGCSRSNPGDAEGKYALVVGFTAPATKGNPNAFWVLNEQIPLECQ